MQTVSIIKVNFKNKCILVGDIDTGEVMHAWGLGVYGASLYISLNFSVNLKLL